MRWKRLAVLGVLAGCLRASGISRAADAAPAKMVWDRDTLRFAASGSYARLARLNDGQLLLSFERRGKSYVQRSGDAGRTWDTPTLAADYAHGGAANPQPLVLADGTLWLFYNERPRDEGHAFTIRLTVSTDNGRTWTPREQPLYTAGRFFRDGCWEPSAVQLRSGEIQLFFANEGPYANSDEQEITLMRTADLGRTWSAPRAVSFRAGHRDGMPVPVELAGGRGVAFAIEDNGVTPDRQFKPAIVHTPSADNWRDLPITPNHPRRWSAVDAPWPAGVYAGAPFLCQLSSGKTLLSCQSDEDGKPATMVVYVGDADAKHFGGRSRPFPNDAGKQGYWNATLPGDNDSVIAVSSTTIGGRSGVWLIDGRLMFATTR